VRLEDLNALSVESATIELLRCCGSRRWASAMAERRPFASPGDIAATADDVWWSLGSADWLEAFASHPRIGAGGAGRAGGAWAAAEQSGMNDASDDVRRRLIEGNRQYEARFGYIFIVCATGKPAVELLTALEHRLSNAPGEELGIAAEEQRKITRLRLDKLLT
jgi:2-oxo-4-hydroxy-4-carboxy-5-ureidoimidazoline decarboxylase